MCRSRALNHLLSNGDELYEEYFGKRISGDMHDVEESGEDAQDRALVQSQNRLKFDDYVGSHIMDKVDQQLFYASPVPDTKDFNPLLYRPQIEEKSCKNALLALGVEEAVVFDIISAVSEFPTNRASIKAIVCARTCCRCHQHELVDGSKILGFKQKHVTLGLQDKQWSEWQRASKRYGDRGRGIGYLMSICQYCWNQRRQSQEASNEKKREKRKRMRMDFEWHQPRHSGQDNAQDKLIEYCKVHRTACENELWEQFESLRQELSRIEDVGQAKKHKSTRIRLIAGNNNVTSAECVLQYDQWPRRQRACDRRILDRVVSAPRKFKLSLWRKFLRYVHSIHSLTTLTLTMRYAILW